MRLLLDTHIALWAIDDLAQLGPLARRRIDGAEEVNVSAITVWEIAIKHALRRGRADDIRMSGSEARERFIGAGFALLPVMPGHAAAVDKLPALHADPFDRMLVAQAMSEPMHLLTRDTRLSDYGSFVILV